MKSVLRPCLVSLLAALLQSASLFAQDPFAATSGAVGVTAGKQAAVPAAVGVGAFLGTVAGSLGGGLAGIAFGLVMAGVVGLREVRYGAGENHYTDAVSDESNPYFSYDPGKCIACEMCVPACPPHAMQTAL